MINYRQLNFLLTDRVTIHPGLPGTVYGDNLLFQQSSLITLHFTPKRVPVETINYMLASITGSHIPVMSNYSSYHKAGKNRRWWEEAGRCKGCCDQLYGSPLRKLIHNTNDAVTNLSFKKNFVGSKVLVKFWLPKVTPDRLLGVSPGTKLTTSWLCLSTALQPWETRFQMESCTVRMLRSTAQLRAVVQRQGHSGKTPIAVFDKHKHSLSDRHHCFLQ